MIATIARMPYLAQLHNDDFLWTNVNLGIWTEVEVGIMIVTTASTTLRPLLPQLGWFAISNDKLRSDISLSDISGSSLGRSSSKEGADSKADQNVREAGISHCTVRSYKESVKSKRNGIVFTPEYDMENKSASWEDCFRRDDTDATSSSVLGDSQDPVVSGCAEDSSTIVPTYRHSCPI
jgi:hypothetical protein